MTAALRRLVATACQILATQGHDDLIWGHASARDTDDRGAWLKAAEWGLDETTPDRVRLVDAAGTVLSGAAARYSEYLIHTEIYAARPDVGAVVHNHQPHVVALTAAGQQLLPVSHAANWFVPPQIPRFSADADLILTTDLGKQVATELGDADALLLVNHGTVTVGSDLAMATVRGGDPGAGLPPTDADRGLRRLTHLVRCRGIPRQAGPHLHPAGRPGRLRPPGTSTARACGGHPTLDTPVAAELGQKRQRFRRG